MITDEDKNIDQMGQPHVDEANKHGAFETEVGTKARRKEWARANPSHPLWSGFSLFGIVGWAVTVPTLLGIALGVWLDRNHPMPHSWTLTMLTAGLVLGCFNAWRWISHEEHNIHNEDSAGEDEQSE